MIHLEGREAVQDVFYVFNKVPQSDFFPPA